MISPMRLPVSCDIVIDTRCMKLLAAKHLSTRAIYLSAVTLSNINQSNSKMDTDLDNIALFDIENAVFNEKDSGLDDFHFPDETLVTISTQYLFKSDKNEEYEPQSTFKVVTETEIQNEMNKRVPAYTTSNTAFTIKTYTKGRISKSTTPDSHGSHG